MRLVNSYILIKVDPIEEQTAGGLYRNPDQVKLPSTGEIIDSADKDYSKGGRVHFLRYASIDGLEEGTRLCKPEHIIAYEPKS